MCIEILCHHRDAVKGTIWKNVHKTTSFSSA
jgi:hypothetical protein